ncbi:MAG: hypothetical protein K2N51_14385 [Lachnospiraceae bacterium]|nr:hypothetical protein [Lachnospiraceae bacterium]
MKKWAILASLLICLLCACGTMEHNGTAGSKVAVEPEVTLEKESKPDPSENEEEVSIPTASEEEEKEEGENTSAIDIFKDSIKYKGKEIKIKTEKDYWYIWDSELVNEKQVAIYLREAKELKILLVYDLDKEEYIVEKEGMDFTWYGEDITTLVYTNASKLLNGYYEVCDYNDKVLYSSKKGIRILDFDMVSKGKIKIRECTDEEFRLGIYADDDKVGEYKEITY